MIRWIDTESIWQNWTSVYDFKNWTSNIVKTTCDELIGNIGAA